MIQLQPVPRKQVSIIHELLEQAKEYLEDLSQLIEDSDIDYDDQADADAITDDSIDQLQEIIDNLYDNFLDD